MEIINVIEIDNGSLDNVYSFTNSKKAEEHFEHILKLMSVPEDEIEVALMDGNYYNNGYEINLTHSYIEN